jgi:hypothetical protein
MDKQEYIDATIEIWGEQDRRQDERMKKFREDHPPKAAPYKDSTSELIDVLLIVLLCCEFAIIIGGKYGR